MLLLLGVAIASNLYQEWNRTLSREQDRLLTQARVVQLNIGHNLASVNEVLAELGKELSGDSAGFDRDFNRRLKIISDAMPAMRTVFVLDGEGTIRASSREALVGKNFSQRAYFSEPRRQGDAGVLYVSPPFRTVLGTFTINVSRVIVGLHGEFAGVVTAALDPAYFSPLLDSVRYAPDMWSAIAHANGEVFMTVPERGGIEGKLVAQPDTSLSRHLASGKTTTVHVGIAYITNDERMLVWSTVQRAGLTMDRPPMVAVARDYGEIVSSWRHDARVQGGLYGLLALASLVGLLVYQRHQAEFDLQSARSMALLRESEEKLRSLYELSPVGIVLSDHEGRQVEFNRAFIDICGYAPEELRLLNSGLLTPEKYARDDARQLETLLSSGQYGPYEKELLRKDGTLVPVRLNGVLMGDGKDLVWSIIEDITDHKRLQDSLREKMQELDTILDNSSVGISFVKDRRQVWSNRRMGELFGYAAEEMENHGTRMFYLDQEAYAALGERAYAVLAKGERFTTEQEMRHRDGHPVWMRISGKSIPPSYTEAGSIWVFEDIGEQKKVELELRRAREAADAASLAKSQFLATMSHEIRTPMNGVLGMAQLLLMPDITEAERREYAGMILHSGQTLLTLLNDILDISKVEAGKLDLAYAAIDPAQMITQVTALFAELVHAKGLKIEATWRGAAGQCYWADPVRLRQMLSNLISNAVKFTALGYVRVVAREIERSANVALLEFAVEDSGIGIPSDKLPLLFKPFSQADGSTTRVYGGTGLGLSIVRSLARLMGGDVGVASEAGKGSRFWFRIRANIPREGEAGHAVEPTERIVLDVGRMGFVLVVEDNRTNQNVVEAMLGKLGIRATSVENGLEAVDAIRRGPRPDIVLMDVQMPVMDGFKATENIRRWEMEHRQSRLPIVALTAGVFDEDRQQCIASGMDDFLAKPISMKNLESVLGKWITSIDPGRSPGSDG